MKSLTILFILVLSFTVFGQSVNDELNRLREHLGVSPGTKITVASSLDLPDKKPLNIYVATGLDIYVKERFVEWADEWNKKDGKKLGMVNLVSDLDAADLIFVRYTLQDQVSTQTNSVVVPRSVYNPATNTMVTTPVAVNRSASVVPVYLYIISKKAEGLEILWRESDQTNTGNFKSAGFSLRDKFKKMMKAKK